MEENNEEKVLTKKELKLKAEEMKLEAKQKKMEEKAAIKEEKERRKNSFGRKVRNFFLTIILVIILLLVGFYFGKQFLIQKQDELSNKKMDQVYQESEQAISEKDYKKAIDLLKSIDENYPKYKEVNKKIKEVEQLYLNEYLSKADEYLKDQKYDKALNVLSKIDDDLQNSDLVISKKADIKIAELKEKIKEMATSQPALSVLDYLSSYDTENIEKIKDAVDELKTQYKNEFVLETRELLKTNYTKAKANINSALKILPDDKDIKNLLEELNQTDPTPVSLTTLKAEKISDTLKLSDGSTPIKSTAGTEYKNYILKSSENNSEEAVEYKLDKNYSRLEGIICTPETAETSNPSSVKITIYDQNGKVLYTTENINNNSFSIDVSKVETLKLVLKSGTNERYFIGNPILTQNK